MSHTNPASQPAPLAELTGKVAYITGASSGIGLGIAQACHEAGMHVVLGDIDAARLDAAAASLRTRANDVHTVQHDVTDRGAWERAADEVERRYGRLHLLVNNAGVGIQTPASAASFKDWEWGLGVNLGGVINGIATCLPRMRAHGEGAHLLATSSLSGMLPRTGVGVYATSKFAVVGLMEALRLELADTNVGTSVFCPGPVATRIEESEAYRPAALANDVPTPAPPMGGAGPDLPLIDPLEAGRIVIDGVRHNDLFIFSHPEYRAGMQMRFDAILASCPPLPGRREISRPAAMRSAVYEQELAHRRAREAGA